MQKGVENYIFQKYHEQLLNLEQQYKHAIEQLLDEKIWLQSKIQQCFQQELRNFYKLQTQSNQSSLIELPSLNHNENNLMSNPVEIQSCGKMVNDENNNNKENENNIKCENTLANTTIILQTRKQSKRIEPIIDNVSMQPPMILNNNEPKLNSNDIDITINIQKESNIDENKNTNNDNNNNHNNNNGIISNVPNTQSKCINNGFECHYCDKIFKTRAEKQSHTARKHIEDKPFKCSQCDKSFALKTFLNSHQIIHSDRFKCNICDKKCMNKHTLKIHKRMHSGEKPFKCNYCNKKFASKSGLSSHKDVHSGNKMYKCAQCDKTFRTKSGLNTHQNIHTTKYQCLKCHKCYSDKWHLNNHLKSCLK